MLIYFRHRYLQNAHHSYVSEFFVDQSLDDLKLCISIKPHKMDSNVKRLFCFDH